MKEIERIFGQMGGTFVSPVEEIAERLKNIRALVFDWDGVFNNGTKDAEGSSNFSEVDSMGTNLLRYSLYLRDRTLPLSVVISGEKNAAAFYFCKRECFNYSFYSIKNKTEALDVICAAEKITPQQIAFFFDDVLDLPIAAVCGLRMMVNQKVNPQFKNYCVQNKLVDYLTAASGGQFAVRESTELLIGLNGNFKEVIASRSNYSENYQAYITQRKTQQPEFFTYLNERIQKSNV